MCLLSAERLRLLASLETYFCATNDDEGIYVNLFVDGHADLTVGERTVSLSQRTRYPWDGDVHIEIATIEEPATFDRFAAFDLHLRVPSWCEDPSLPVKGELVVIEIDTGYATIQREWTGGDTIDLSLLMTVETLSAHPDVKVDAGRVALRRSPVVYYLEGIDNDRPLHHLQLPHDSLLYVGTIGTRRRYECG